MSARPERCPHCGTSLIGEPIPERHRTHGEDHDAQVERWGRCYCLPWGDTTHFRREIGHEISEVYDGILYWSCPDCGMAWERWTDGAGRLTERSSHYVGIHNVAAANARGAAS